MDKSSLNVIEIIYADDTHQMTGFVLRSGVGSGGNALLMYHNSIRNSRILFYDVDFTDAGYRHFNDDPPLCIRRCDLTGNTLKNNGPWYDFCDPHPVDYLNGEP